MTVAAAAIALFALSTAPASGGFRYVPPAEPGFTQAEEVAPEEADIDDAPGSGPAVPGASVFGTSVSGTSVSGASVWRVHEGEMLRGVLARWAARAGAEVLFLTDRRYRLDGEAAFEGEFADAVQAVFRSLSHLPHAPVAARSEGGTTLVVRHRVPGSGGNKAVP